MSGKLGAGAGDFTGFFLFVAQFSKVLLYRLLGHGSAHRSLRPDLILDPLRTGLIPYSRSGHPTVEDGGYKILGSHFDIRGWINRPEQISA
jgi:hypothetical protein